MEQDNFLPSSSKKRKIIDNPDIESEDDSTANRCVICLEEVTERATAHPCNHNNFDFICLASWLEQKNTCPLCKSRVSEIRYGQQSSKPSIYRIDPGPTPPPASIQDSTCGVNFISSPWPSTPRSPSWLDQFRSRPEHQRRRLEARKRRRRLSPPPTAEEAISRRKRIYDLNLFSLHVGSNRVSQYSELSPERFAKDPRLTSRARMWLRRELEAFDFLSSSTPSLNVEGARPTSSPSSKTPAEREAHARRLANREFLMDYIIAVLRTVDIKDTRGRAQELLTDYLGDRTALFLHELQAWLRSPFEDLAVWDRNVRYAWPEGAETTSSRVTARNDASGEVESWNPSAWKRRRIARGSPD